MRYILALIAVFAAFHFQVEIIEYIENILFSLSEEDLYESVDYVYTTQEELQITFQDIDMQQRIMLAAGIPFFGYMILWIMTIAYSK